MRASLSMLRKNQLTLLVLLIVTFIYVLLVTQHQMTDDQVQQRFSWRSCSPSSVIQNDSYTDKVELVQSPSNESDSVKISRSFYQYLVSKLRNSAFPGARNYSEYILIQQPERFSILSHVHPLRSDFGPVVNDVTSFRYPIDIEPCHPKNPESINVIDLFVVVISAPSYFDKRDAIRTTWLSQLMPQFESNNETSSTVKLVGHGFIVGLPNDEAIQKSIEEESEKHGDILQVDMVDSYADLTSKVASALNWLNSRCSRVDVVLKVDDDVYVNTRNLISVVRTMNSSAMTVFGTSADGKVRRDGKFQVSVDMWPWSNYPPYSMGAFLLMAGSVVQPLLAAAQTTPYFPFEDTYLGLCADKAGVKMRFSPRALAGFMTSRPKPCHVHNSISWLTQSAEIIDKSHKATVDFYSNATHCKQMVETPIDPNKMTRHFVFT